MRCNRGDIESTMKKAMKVAAQRNTVVYVIPTYYGFSITNEPAPFGRKCYKVGPQCSPELVGGFPA